MSLPDREVIVVAWPDAEVEARWTRELERACRHLSAFKRTRVRAIIVAEMCRGGEAEVQAVRDLAEELALVNGLVASVVCHGDRLTVRLSPQAKTPGG